MPKPINPDQLLINSSGSFNYTKSEEGAAVNIMHTSTVNPICHRFIADKTASRSHHQIIHPAFMPMKHINVLTNAARFVVCAIRFPSGLILMHGKT